MTALVCLIGAGLLCLASPAMATAPDLTAGGVPTDNTQWNLGPSGMAGWFYREGISTANARQILVVSVATGSPADGIMLVNDVILGASGTGADPVNFTNDARPAFAQAITDAEANSPATLKILRWRAGVTNIVSLTLETLGAYSDTAPYNCPKSAAILEKGLQWIMANNAFDGNWCYSSLTLLAANDPSNPNNAARQAKATNELRGLMLSPATIARYTSGVSVGLGLNEGPFNIGPKLIALSEYYLKTRDPDVLPSIRAYALCVAYGQSFLGTCGHFFTDPGFRNNPVNGPYNIGYGPINSAALPCYVGLILANKCGLNDPDILAGIQRASIFYAEFTHLGCAGYGEGGPYGGNDTNGKSGLAALAFALEGDRPDSTKFYAKSSTAAAIAERDIGHTGSFFAYLYAPLGANVGGPEAIAYYFKKTRWMYELARRWDGSFVYDSYSSGQVGPDSVVGQGGCLMATPMLLTYALPLRQTYLTGYNQDTNNWICSAEMPDVAAASADTYDFPSHTTAQLLLDITNWSHKFRGNACSELATRTADYATILPAVQAMATNLAGTLESRLGACEAMGDIGDSNSVPVLVSLLTDTNFPVRYTASSAINNYLYNGPNNSANIGPLQPYIATLMQACIANQKPLLPIDPQDPMQLVNGNILTTLFAPFGVLYYNNLVGLDRNLLYGAMRACAANPQAGVRDGLNAIYPKLTAMDIINAADVFVNIAYDNAPAGMGLTGARLPALTLLQSNGKAEGVPLAIRFAEDLAYNQSSQDNSIVGPINLLADYAGSCRTVTPDPQAEHYCQMVVANGLKFGVPEAQAAINAIDADTSPVTLTPFKGIDWVFPDDAAFNLPRRWTTLRVFSHNYSNTNSVYTWRKVRGAGCVNFTPNGTSDATNTIVIFDGTPGQYLFEVTMSDSHGLTEVTNTVAVSLLTADGILPANLPPTASSQSITTSSGTPTQVILTGADPEGYALIYTVTNAPAHGLLSGTAPNLVYTPAVNYIGADSLTFQVQDSEGQTASATVNFTVGAASPVGLAIYEPFNYPVGNLNGESGTSEIGLTGTWEAASQITVEAPSLNYGTLPTNGNRINSVAINNGGASRPISPNALVARGLLADGATLWFSVEMGGYGGWIGAGGNDIDLALANNSFPSASYGSNISTNGGQPGSGLGVRLNNTQVLAAQYFDASVGGPLTGTWDDTITGSILPNSPRLVVGKITWGATNDTVEIYLPNTDMVLPAPCSVLTTTNNVNQTNFNTLTFSRGGNVLLDEIRFGPTLQSVLQGTVAMTNDVTPPTPNPMTFAVAPQSVSSSTITMTATPAFDGLGVEYLFTCTGGGGNSSGWQTNNVYTDTGLTPGATYSYTVTARDNYPGWNQTAASAPASATIPTQATVPGVGGLSQALAQIQITNAALVVGTVTTAGSYSLAVPAGNVLSQTPAADTAAGYGSAVNLVISIGQDPALPVLTPANIVDDRGGQTVQLGTAVTYTLTFSKNIDATTLNAGDFTNAGTVPITIGAINEISPGVVTVVVTPVGTNSGSLRLAVAAGAVIQDTLGNSLNTTAAIADDTVIAAIPVQPNTQVFTGNNSTSADNWNNALNWNVNTGPVPSGTDNVSIPIGKQVTADSASTPVYSGNLALADGAILTASYSLANSNVFNCLGTPGKTMISLGDGSVMSFRNNFTVLMPAITLQGNSELVMGSSVVPSIQPIFNYPITGPYSFTLAGKSDAVANFNVTNNFGGLYLSTQYGSLYTVNANVAGALSGNVTVMADYTSGGKGANLIFNAPNVMPDTATLSLYGNTGTLVTLNYNDTIGGLKLNGVLQLPGIYSSNNASWLGGAGVLTVTGPASAYWNPPGGPAGIWDGTSSIWNTLADLTGVNSPWSPGQIAVFNASGTYTVTLASTNDIGGLVVSNGAVTLASGGLNLTADAPVNVASGASLTLGTVIAEDSAGSGIHKSGAGTLVLSGLNTFTGPVLIGSGILTIANIDMAGNASALGQYPNTDVGGLYLAGGMLRYTGGPTAVNRGFTFTGNSTIDISIPDSSLTFTNVEVDGPGILTVTGGAGTALGLGNIRMVQGNGITLNPIGVAMSVASVEGYSSYPIASTITLAGTSSNNVVTGDIYSTYYPGSAYPQGTLVVKNGPGAWTLAGPFTATAVNNNNIIVNQGTLTLASANNTYAGNTLINNSGRLVLDYTTGNTNKIGENIAPLGYTIYDYLFFSGGILELKGGSYTEVLAGTTLNVGPTAFITRNGGTSELRMNGITRKAGSTICFADDTVADTDNSNTNGILGGYATIGADWAVSASSATNTPITPLGTYAPWTSSGGSAAANYLLSGSAGLTGALAANSLKIANTANSQTLNLGANALTITATSASGLGGILYAGGNDNQYTINGAGGLLASTATGELIVNTHAGILTINAPVVTTGATAGLLTKSGNGTLILGGTNYYTGATVVADGKLFVNGSLLASAFASLTVYPGATLGGSGSIGRNVTIADGGQLQFNLSTNAANHVPLTVGSGNSFTFAGASVLTITTTGGAAPGTYKLITGGNNLAGVAPTNLVLPPGCVATVSIATNSLLLNVTAINPLPSYTVSYDGNGNFTGNVPVASGGSYLSGTNVTVSDNTGGLTKNGYTFAGWNTAPDGSGTAYAAGATFAIAANTVLYAQWAANPYTLTFNANGGATPSPTNMLVNYNSPYGTLATVSFTGYSFNGWFTAATNGTLVTSNTIVGITTNQTLYAQWTPNTYTVTFDWQGGSGGTTNVVATFGAAMPAATAPLRASYAFGGYYAAAGGGGTQYYTAAMASTTNWNVPANTTLYAAWSLGANNGTWIQTKAGPFNWGAATNWSGGIIANGPDATAFFTPNITAAQTVNLDSALTNGNITFTTTSAYDLTISGANVLTLSRTAGMPVIDVTQSGRTLTIASVITGINGLQKNSAGNLRLTANNTFSGGLVLNAGSLLLNNAQSYTGGITLNGGTLGGDTTNALPVAALNGNSITVNGSSVMSVTNSGFIAGGILINPAGWLKLATPSGTANVNGVLSGSGILDVGQIGGSGSSITLSNTANTFTGGVFYSAGNSGSFGLNVNSFADSASLGAGNIQMGNGNAASSQTFALNAGAIAPLVFNNRQFELDVNNVSGQLLKIANNSAQPFTINSPLLCAGTGSKTLTFGGIGTGVSTFAGNIGNGNLTNLSLIKADSGTWTLAGNLSHSGGLTINGGTVILSGVNTYSGTTTFAANYAALVIQGAAAFSPNTRLLMNNNASSDASTLKLLDDSASVYFPNTIDIRDNNSPINVHTIFVGNNNTANGGNNPGSSTTNSTMTLGAVTFTNGMVAGAYAGEIAVVGTNGYRLQVNSVILNNLAVATVGTNTMFNPTTASLTLGNVTMAAGNTNARTATLDLDGTNLANQVVGVISDATDAYSGGAPLKVIKTSTSTWTLTGTNTYSGGTALSAGILQADNNSALGTGLLVLNGGTLSNNVAGITLTNPINLAANTTMGVPAGNNFTLTGVITNTFALTKLGAGSLTLSGTNAYKGTTTVSAGKLFIDGDQTAATNTLAVATNATLGGIGIIGGNITVSNGAKLEFNISTNAPNFIKLNLAATKTLSLSNAVQLVITSSGGVATGAYTLITAPGGIIGSAPTNVSLPAGWAATVSKAGNDLVLNVTSEPNPAISTSGTLAALNTTYGTPSSATSFTVSGTTMAAGITVTPPVGFEISTNSGIAGFVGSGNAITIGTAGTVPATTVYVRLAATATAVSSPYTGNIVCSSTGVTSVNVATVSSTVNPAALTITGLTGAGKVYDGTTAAGATGTPAYVGLQNGEFFAVTGTPSFVFADKHVGVGKAITVTDYTAPSGNYTVTQPTGLSANITAQAVTVSAVPSSKTYDGTTTSSGTPTISPVLASGDTASALSQTFSTKHVGTGKTLMPSVTINDGNGGNNYSVTLANNPNGVITAKAVTVTALTDSKTYDGTTTSSPTPTISPALILGDTTSVLSQAFDTKNVGTGKTLTPVITINDGNSGNNYSVTLANNTGGVITAKGVTVTAVTDSKTYDGTTSSSGTPTISPVLVSGDTTNALGQTFDTKHVGTSKTLTPSVVINDGNGGNNYSVTLANNTNGVITTKAVTFSAVTDSKTYDGTTSSAGTPTISPALASGDTTTILNQTFDTKNVGTGKTLTPSVTINDGNGGNNYSVTLTNNASGVITAKAVTVTAATDSKTYDGTTTSSGTPTISPVLASGDTTSALSQTFDTKHVGIGKTLTPVITINDGNSGNNYSVTLANNTGGVIAVAGLTITAVANTKTYDATTSAAAVPTYSTVFSPDTVTVLVEAYLDSNVGSNKTLVVTGYSINDGNGGNNYSVTLANNTNGAINPLAQVWWDGGAVNITTNGNGASAGGAGTWDTTIQNWDRGSGVAHAAWTNANNDIAVFGGTAGTVSLGTPVSAAGLMFSTANYVLTNSTLTLTLGGNITANANATIASQIAGTTGLLKAGTGTLTLTATNNYSGGTVINAGTVAPQSTTVAANLGGTGANLTFNGSGTLSTVYGGAGNFGGLAITNGAVATLAGGSGATFSFSGAATGNGTLLITSPSGGGVTAVNLNGTANTFTGSIIYGGAGSPGAALTFNSLLDTATPTPIYLQIGNGQFYMSSNAPSSVALTNRYLQIGGNNTTTTLGNSSATNTFGIFSDLQMTGTGTQTVNFYGATGPTNEFGGVIGNGTATTLNIGVGPYVPGALTSPLWYLSNTNNTFNGQVTLGYGAPTLIAKNIASNGVASSLGKGGTIVVNGGGVGMASLIFVGAGSTTDRGLQIGGNSLGASLLNNGTGALTFTANPFNPVAATASAYTLTLGGNYTGSANQIQGAIQNNNTGKIALTKTGAGTWVLTGTNTYTGSTTVSNGTLLVNGSITSAVTNKSGSVFGGTGSVTGAVNFNTGAGAQFTLGSPLTIVGTMTLSSNTVYLNLSNNVPAGVYTLATCTQTGSSGTFNATPTIVSGSLSAGATATVTNGGGVVNLVVTGGGMAPMKLVSSSTTTKVKGQFSRAKNNGGAAVTVTYSGVPGSQYIVQRSTDLVSWENLTTNVMPAEASAIYSDKTPPTPQAFYRVVPLP